MKLKLRKICVWGFLVSLAPTLGWLSGCGSSHANVITISITSSVGTVLILGQSTTLTVTVTGATNTNVNWEGCTYTTTTTSSSGSSTTSKPTNCPTDGSFGTLSNEQATGTATYTAPGVLPDQTKFPGLQLIFTAQSQQDTSRTGTVTITLTSGIAVHLTPVTATVPTNELQSFFVTLDNDLQSKGVTWLITQSTPTSTTPLSMLPTCSPGCGTVTQDTSNPNHATYKAPATVPTSTSVTSTPANVTVVATSVADTSCSTCVVSGTVTIIQGGPITFSGISPTIAPQGAFYWDIYLNAPNISSSSVIALNQLNSQGGIVSTTPIDPNQPSFATVKVLFPIPTSTTPNPASTGARLRLFSSALSTPGAFSVTVSDPGETVTMPNPPSAYTFNVLPVRPTSTATVPSDVLQGTTNDANVTVDGGYFGTNGGLAKVSFQGNSIAQDTNNPSTAKQLHAILPASQINSFPPGLYPLSVVSTSAIPPTPNNPAVTNIAIFPNYQPPSLVPTLLPGPIPAGTNPSAIDIDTSLGVIVVAETGSNQIQFYKIGPPTGGNPETLVPIDGSGNPCAGGCPIVSTAQAPLNVPTGLSVNSSNHTVAVVNYGTQTGSGSNVTLVGQSVTVLPIPVPGGPQNPAPGTPFFIDLTGVFQSAFQGSTNPIPLPYSIGVDADSNLALVAFSSTSVLSAANLGFVVNLNPNTQGSNSFGCSLGQSINPNSNKFGQCVYSQVTLDTGTYPHVAVAPHRHIAYVTPGQAVEGVVRGIDVTKASTSTQIASVSLTAGLVTVTTTTPHNLTPGNAGTVLITGVPNTNNSTVDYNGVFTVAVTSSMTFTYALTSTATDTETGTANSFVFYSNPNQEIAISASVQGIAINPITLTAAMADENVTSEQIDLLNSLDQSVTSISFRAGCTAFTPTTTTTCTTPELTGTSEVAWQPYSNAVVSYNPKLQLVSVSDPAGLQRQGLVMNLGPSAVVFPVTNGTTGTLTLWGGVAVDPATNYAFVLESGSGPQQPGQIEIINLGPAATNGLKPTQITELVVPGASPGVLGGIPKALVPQATVTSTTDLAGVKIFGSGFGAPANVRLDGVSITGANFPTGSVTVVSPREIDVTIPAAFLSVPHRYAVDLLSTVNGNVVQSNTTDFVVVQTVDLSNVCAGGNVKPSGVAIADQVANGPFSPIAVITNSGCNSVSVVDINPTITSGGVTMPNPTFGKVLNTVAVGAAPQGIAISPRLGLAVTANNGGNGASIIDLTQKPPVEKVADVPTGTAPIGVAIDEETGAAIVANNGSNTVSLVDLGLLFPPSGTPPTSLPTNGVSSIGGIQQPIAVAIDPDRGTNNQGIAVVTALQLVNGSAPVGALAVVDIGLSTPSLSTTISSGSVTATPTGIVFDPSAVTTTTNQGLFYANSSGASVIAIFNPDTGGGGTFNVGINPTSLAINPQTGALLTANSASNTISIVDTLSSPLRTLQTLGIPGSPTFGVAIDPFTNLAVIVDQANSRLFLFEVPN